MFTKETWLAVLLAVCCLGVSSAADSAAVASLMDALFAKPPSAQEAEVVRADGKATFVLKGEKASVTLDFGPLAVKPNTSYTLTARMRALGPSQDAGLQILVREIVKRRIVQPYFKNPARARALPDEACAFEKGVSFKTGAETDQISGALFFAGGPGRVELVDVVLVDDAGQEAAKAQADKRLFGEQIERLKREAAGRKPLAPRPLVFSRSQVKYGLERDYYRAWIDRPLFTDRACRAPAKHVTPFESFKRVVAIGQRYGIDGFAFMPETKGRMGVFEMISQIAPKDFGVLGEFVGSTALELKSESIGVGLKCPEAARFNGKLLITSYGADGLTPAQWKEMLDALRKQHGDVFLFLPSIASPVRFRQNYAKGLPFEEKEMEEVKAGLRAWLEVCDGIYFNYPAAFKLYEDRRKFDDGFYRDIFIPVFKSVLAEPKYQGKLLGLSAYHSHYNADISLGLQEDNTKTLRRSVETALAARPEVVILPEWDEQNENTSFRPTVFNSLSTMRVFRYYMAGLKGQPLSPMEGDDPETPNLVVSFRKVLVLGEELEIELLNIPDSTYAGPYEVTVRLVDASGKEVAAFAPAKMDGSRLHDVTLKLGTEALASCAAARPEVRVTGWRGKESVWLDGLHHIRLRAGSNWDCKYVKLPLRDQLRPGKAAFALQVKDGRAVVTGEVACDTPIAYVEALEDDDVAWAMDPANEFMQDTPGVKRFCVEYRSTRATQDKLRIEVDRPVLKWFSNAAILHQNPDSLNVEKSAIAVETAFSPHVRWSVFAVKDEDCAAATVSLAATAGQASVKLADVLAKGPWAHVFPNGLCVTVSEREKPLDIPKHLDMNSAKVTASFRPQSPDRVIHVRVIAKNGRIWRGAPMPLPFAGEDLKETTLRVYSAAKEKPADVKVAAGRIASFAYEFTPARGDILWSSPRYEFSGALAGFPDALTLQGGNAGYSSSQFAGSFAGKAYLDGSVSFAPKWAVVDGRPCLVFDGQGAFVALPRETIPRHGSFVIEFEIKPESMPTGKGRQFVFSHRLIRPNSLSVFLSNGRINAEFSLEGHGMAVDDEGLPIEAGKWSKVRVTRDFENLTLEVDGKSVSTPCARPGFDIGPMSFGGFGKTPAAWFKGCLAGVRIAHNSAR